LAAHDLEFPGWTPENVKLLLPPRQSRGNSRLDSSDVNSYLREISGQDFTAKDFRTWAGSVAACALLRGLEPFASPTQAKKNLVGMIKDVASQLGKYAIRLPQM
jgi:DNA topoisomerase IB